MPDSELVVGRDESPGRQWTQAVVLGLMLDLFFAPAFGFPIMSKTGSFWLFLAAILVFLVPCVLGVRRLRANRAVRIGADAVVLVEGGRRTRVEMARIRGARYDPSTRQLELSATDERWELRLPHAQGAAAVRAVGARIRGGKKRGGASGPPRSSG